MADGGHVCQRIGILLILAQLDTEGNILTKFQNNPTSGLGGHAITRNVYRRTPESSQTAKEAPLDYVQKS